MQPGNNMPCAAARALTRSRMYTRALTRTFRPPNNGVRLASFKVPPKTAAKPLPYQPTRVKTKPPSGQHEGQHQHQHQHQQQQHQTPKKQGQPRDQKAPISDLVRERWFPILGFGSAILCLGYFTASLTMYWRQEPATCYPVGLEPETPTGRPSIQSPMEFDMHLDKSEWRFGITRLRRELSAGARGHVLEVAMGTGRNLEFYDWGAVTASLIPPAQTGASSSFWSWIPGFGNEKDVNGKMSPKPPQATENAVLSFTGVDISPGMLDIALKRIRQFVPHMADQVPTKSSFTTLAAATAAAAAKNNTTTPPTEDDKTQPIVSFIGDRIRLLQSDAQSSLPSPPTLPPSSPNSLPPQTKYDTIIQSFGLCSVRDPVSLVSLMASSLQPETGRILLLEHGRSVWDLVNGLLDRGARGHHERFGCWWNRDIEVIVAAAARRVPGLEIVRLERPGWATAGTHVVVELRVRAGKEEEEEEGGGEAVLTKKGDKGRKVSGWASILPPLISMKSSDSSEKKN
ncbi:hypothetical protein GGR50DRAFT_663670 [Xylaria sp. CBS 124048]|nr:hypothetical protein GGR50DRAFT_663670 [Xylaria sp. CBS 124048]